MTHKPTTISIIGLGRFGQLLATILEKDFKLIVSDINVESYVRLKSILKNDFAIAQSSEDIFTADAVFYCVPISKFESVIKQHRPHMNARTVIIDVLSVKLYAKSIFDKYLPVGVQAILTHPMFGPDSVRMKGLMGQPMIIDWYNADDKTYSFWKDYFAQKGLQVVEMSAKDHDINAAKSQGVTHFIGRVLEAYDFVPTSIDSFGAKKLHEVTEQTCNDTWELFVNLQNYNPYTKKMRLSIGKAYDKTYNALLPKRVSKDVITFGIQGGKGSFNEQAIHDYISRHRISKYRIEYLYTTDKVLRNLHYGNIDFGLFAMHNSVGGIVTESIHAIAKYKFEIVEEFAIRISHHLMRRKDAQVSDIFRVIAHDQVLKQCRDTLLSRYPHLKQETGKGDYIDTATAAKALSEGKIDKNTFILGNEIIANLYDFDIVDHDLQDAKENLTSFLLVERVKS